MNSRPTDPEENEEFAGMFRSLPGPFGNDMRALNKEPIVAVPTPFPTWNRTCRDDGGGQGLPHGWHVVIAGRSGSGKSLIGLNMAREAMAYGEEVFYISLEMSAHQIGTRFLAVATDTEVHKLERGPWYDEVAFDDALAELEILSSLNGGAFQVNQKRITSLEQVLRCMRWAYEYRGSSYFIVDYLQRAAADQNDPGEIARVSHEVQALSYDLSTVSVALSQFNRETSRDTGKPSIWGLMGGSAIENDSDQVWLMDHSRFEQDVSGFNSYLIEGKNRHGPTAEFGYHRNARTLRVHERS